jgi:hypothetical protein
MPRWPISLRAPAPPGKPGLLPGLRPHERSPRTCRSARHCRPHQPAAICARSTVHARRPWPATVTRRHWHPKTSASCRIWRKPTTTGQRRPSGIARGETTSSADCRKAADRRTEAGRLPWAAGQAMAIDTCRTGRRCLPRGASSPTRQGVTDSPRSSRIFADHLSETAQVTDTERLTWPSAARRSRRSPLCQAPIAGSACATR